MCFYGKVLYSGLDGSHSKSPIANLRKANNIIDNVMNNNNSLIILWLFCCNIVLQKHAASNLVSSQ